MAKSVRALVSVGLGKHARELDQLIEALPDEEYRVVAFHDCYPPGSPTHPESPYAFKVYALQEAVKRGCTTLLWCDTGVVPECAPESTLEPIWTYIEQHGWWLPLGPGKADLCSDKVRDIVGMTLAQLADIPRIATAAFGLDMRKPKCRLFLDQWKLWIDVGACQRAWDCSAVASVVAYCLDMSLTAGRLDK